MTMLHTTQVRPSQGIICKNHINRPHACTKSRLCKEVKVGPRGSSAMLAPDDTVQAHSMQAHVQDFRSRLCQVMQASHVMQGARSAPYRPYKGLWARLCMLCQAMRVRPCQA